MKNLIAQNKKLLCAIGCGLLVAIILVVVFTACVDDDKNVTEPTGVVSGVAGSTSDSIATTPGDATEPDVIEPGDVTEPTMPDMTEPQEPTEPEKPAAPREPHEVTAGTIRATDWNSWDNGKKQAFLDSIDWNRVTPEERHNWELAHRYDDYDCGFEGHACRNDLHHESVMAEINAGCDHCGKHDCPSLLTVNPADLFTEPDSSKCPKYDITKDPSEYCQVCSKPHHGEPGTICVIYNSDGNCYACGAWIKAWTCHCCDPDDLD